MLRRCLLLTLLALLGAPVSRADLVWQNPWQSFQRSEGDGRVETSFAFKNTGDRAVTIRHVKTSCGCTTAKLAKNTYEPGESGEIAVKFTLGNRKGAQRKIVTVTTDDKPAPTELNLVVRIFEPLAITPALVFWKVGDTPATKTVQLTVGAGSRVGIKSIVSSDPRVTAKLGIIKSGEQYTVEITPADTAEKASAELTVQTDSPPDQPRSYRIFARIK